MPVQPAFMLIADIGGYTQFMKMNRTSLAHAHDIIARLLEAVIDAAGKRMTLAKLEGDAAFFYAGFAPNSQPSLGFVPDQVARMYGAFHQRVQQMVACNLCACDGCKQAGNLKIKFASHFGEAAVHKVKRMTELAGVDVILVHRLLKNDVPIPEYLLMTQPVLEQLNDQVRQRAAAHSLQLEGLGEVPAYFVNVTEIAESLPSPSSASVFNKVAATLGMAWRTLPFMVGLRRPCEGCRNIPGAVCGS